MENNMAEYQSAHASYRVRAVHCDFQSSDEQVYQALKRATGPLSRSWERLRNANKIGIKFNQDWNRERVPYYMNQRQQLVSDPVARAVLRLLREETRAELFVVDVGVEAPTAGHGREYCTNLSDIFREYEVPFINGHKDDVVWKSVPGGGLMFEKYPLPRSTVEADEMISVQKIKNHMFMGITLCMKNLFGLVPLQPLGRPRLYYHHFIRMPYMLADLGKIFNPALSILDGVITQAGEEWGKGEHPRICNTLIAGDQVVATDACAATLMGHNPTADWPAPPYHRDRNALLAASQAGFGTVNLNQIDFESEVSTPIGEFFARETDPRGMIISWRRSMAEQALYYLENRKKFFDRYHGQYILLQMGDVRWAGASGVISVSRRLLSGDHPEQSMWLKYVDPDEDEQEHFVVYEKTLAELTVR